MRASSRCESSVVLSTNWMRSYVISLVWLSYHTRFVKRIAIVCQYAPCAWFFRAYLLSLVRFFYSRAPTVDYVACSQAAEMQQVSYTSSTVRLPLNLPPFPAYFPLPQLTLCTCRTDFNLSITQLRSALSPLAVRFWASSFIRYLLASWAFACLLIIELWGPSFLLWNNNLPGYWCH